MIKAYVAIAVATAAACELALRLPLRRVLASLTATPRRIAHVIGAKSISDTWKERVLPVYAGRLMGASLGLLGLLLVIAAPVVLAAALATGSPQAAGELLMSLPVLLLMLAGGAIYVVARTRLGR